MHLKDKDRFWTGGGFISWTFDNNTKFTLGTDVFTGELLESNKYKVYDSKNLTFQENGHIYYNQFNKYKGFTTGQIYGEFTNKNNSFRVGTSGNLSMISQNFIHDKWVHIPRFLSKQPNSLFGSFKSSIR